MGEQASEPAPRTARKPKMASAAASTPAPRRRSEPATTEYSPPDVAATLLRLSRDVVCVLDQTLQCHYLTDNWEGLSGFPAAEELGAEFKSHIAPDHLRRVSNYLTQGNDKTDVRFQIKDADGRWRWCELQLAGMEHGDSETPHYKCILRDVTDIVMSQGKLEKLRLEADLAIKSRSEFLANMSHELRTPLNAILGFAQMIESGTYGDIGHEKYHDYIGSIQESGTTLLSKINDLLEIANIDIGRLELRETECDLADIVRHAVEFHSHRAFAGQVHLRLNLPQAPLMVNVDRIRMLQVLTNLMSNAIKHSKPGGTVDIACEIRRDGGINIVIEDNGGGIMPTHLQNILTAFRQDNSFFARSRDCVGLGLALSKEIVKLHQGRIEIDSAPGKGTLLTIRLPRERTVKKAVHKAEPTEAFLS